MAHGLTTQTVKVHQALHGYADGHRQLALSTTLKPRDLKTLLVLSDVSGPGGRLQEDGYLSGYPLADSGFYALARTWPAPEMPRPGCVWTHTLLIDFTDLATLETLTFLQTMFRRPPSASATAGYDAEAISDTRAEITFPAVFPLVTESWALVVMAQLYGNPRSPVIVGRPGDEVDDAVLALWSQQWPRLRRSFKFCTFAASNRSADGERFDLQVLPGSDRNIRTKLDLIDNEAIIASRWLNDAFQDLLLPDHSGLRTFFRRVGADIAGGREAFRPLCLLHRAVTSFQNRPEAVHDAIAILRDEFSGDQSRTAEAIVATAALEKVGTLDEPSFDFLWNSLDLVNAGTLASGAAQLGRSAWRRNPDMLVPFLDNEKFGFIVERTLAQLEIADLAAGLMQAPALRTAALALRPELVGQPAFWAGLEVVEDPFRTSKSEHMEAAAVEAILLAGRDDLATRAVHEFGPRRLLRSISTSSRSIGDRLGTWLRASVSDTVAVAEFLATQPAISRPMLYGLARALPPDAVPNEYGEDPWLIAHRNAEGPINEAAASYTAAYLMSRALGERSRCSGELAQLSFESIHAAVANDQLPDEGWRLLELRLPRSSYWRQWDRCHRLRSGVTDLFIDRDLAPGIFARLCGDDSLFSLLSREAADSWRGRYYLKRVRQYIADERDASLASRAGLVEEVLR